MPLFKRKKDNNVETDDAVKKILKDIENLSDTDKERLATELVEDELDEEIEDVDKNDSGKEEAEMTQDERDIAEAKKDIAEKGSDSQTEKDRIDESVGEQEKADGDENSQDAKDRVDESEGTEKADEERHEASQEDRLDKIENLLLKVVEMLTPKKTEEQEAVEESAKEIYGLGNGVFSDSKGTVEEKKITSADVARTINKIMR
jgi:hypothetical protein